uniref:Transmembrane protein n=1 Tax=Mimiviridae sp. ChoanoV1 TaxID=2596887 RepID=A0A5B8IE99_9VIRU|nr:hypothetical protein 5_73 [Mimiviridae sp. ChoanoV1]
MASFLSGGGSGLAKWIPLIFKLLMVIIGFFLILLTLPAAPIIIYLTILFQVIKLMWGKLKNL